MVYLKKFMKNQPYFSSLRNFKRVNCNGNEPGIYIPNKLGIRIEDMYIITDGLPELITKVLKPFVFQKLKY